MTTDRTRTLLAEAIEASPLSHKEIAAELDIQKNFVTMWLQGLLQVPLYLIPRLSHLLQMDERQFMVAAIEEYHPEVFEAFARVRSFSREDIEHGLLAMCRMANARRSSPTP